MKVLYDCFSCSPYYGSDEGIGWLWPYNMREYHEVWALVRSDRRADIEEYCKKNNINDIHFIYADIPKWMNFYYKNKKKHKNGTLDFLLYQLLWQIPAYLNAKKVHEKVKFDIIHKVGTNDFRFIGFLYRLNTPYIIGPIGGAQETPDELKYYVRSHMKQEKLRLLLNRVLTSTYHYKRALEKADKIYFSNVETMEYVSNKISDQSKCEILTEIGWDSEKQNVFYERRNDKKQEITFLWAGRLEYRKGLELLFDVLDYLPEGNNWKLIICGEGSEKEYYQNIVSNRKYRDKVRFAGEVPYDTMKNYYLNSDVFVFPSLRETTGTVLIEAMSFGLPVVALKQGGAAEIVSEHEGNLISGNSREDIIREFSDVLKGYILNRETAIIKGKQARKKVISHYSWDDKIKKMSSIYEDVVNKE